MEVVNLLMCFPPVTKKPFSTGFNHILLLIYELFIIFPSPLYDHFHNQAGNDKVQDWSHLGA